MNAPDKIYYHKGALNSSRAEDDDIEYLRKDALLEWTKDLKHIYEIPVNNHQASKLCRAQAKALQNVIDKIESL